MKKSIINQAEKGFAAYINGNKLGTILQPFTGYAAHTLTPLPLDSEGNATGFATLTPPFIVFTGQKPLQLGYNSGIYELVLTARLEVQIDDTQSNPGEDPFTDYVESLRDLMEEDQTAFFWFNSANPINFTNFGLSTIVFQDERLLEPQDGRHLVFEADYYIGATANSS